MSLRLAVFTIIGSMLVACGARQDPAARKRAEALRDRWERVHALELAGKSEQALAGYLELCDVDGSFERACYDALRLRFEQGGDEHIARDAVRFMQTFPDSGLAPQLVKHLSRWFISSGDAVELHRGAALLEQTAHAVVGEDLEDTLWYEAGRLHRSAGRSEEAERCLRRVVQFGRWGSQLWDDALWRLAEVHREQGDFEAEIQALEELIGSDESSAIVGSYRSGRVDDALLRLGELLYSLGRIDDSYDIFMKLAGREQSRLSDDGLYRAAELALTRGDLRKACRLLERLLEDMSDSGRADDARMLADEKCNAVR